MKTYTTEEIKDRLWSKGIQILYTDLRVLLKYIVKGKTKGHYAITYEQFVVLERFLSGAGEYQGGSMYRDKNNRVEVQG